MGFVVDSIFTVVFGAARLGLGTPLLVAEYRNEHAHWFMKLGATLLYLVSIVWFVAILNMFRKKYLSSGSRSKSA